MVFLRKSTGLAAIPLFLMAIALSGCGIPADPSGTLDRVRRERIVNVGLVSDHGRHAPSHLSFVNRIARDTGSRVAMTNGPAEELLPRLESGTLDVVVGAFAPDSPWSKHITLLHPDSRPEPPIQTSAAAVRNGENAWIAFIDRRLPELGAAAR